MITKQYDLIGGRNHGAVVGISEAQYQFNSPVFPSDDENRDSSYADSYTRRHFEREEFGDSYECFGLASDDDKDTRELARMVLSHRISAHFQVGSSFGLPTGKAPFPHNQKYEFNNSKTRIHLVPASNAIDPVTAAAADGLVKVEAEVGYEKTIYHY